MLVFNDNYLNVFPIFEETINKAEFVSFDCEMTGVTLESKTDGTKYDTQQFRYQKQREVVQQFNLVQIGFTFYLRGIKEIMIENSEKKKKEELYIERTFTFYLFKNSKLRFLNNNIFNSEMMCHPASLKFLNENNFDLNILVSKGISYNKLEYKDNIIKVLKEEQYLFCNNAMFLSKENEENLIEALIKITEYLLDNSEYDNEKTNSIIITLNSKQTLLFLLGINLKKLLYMNNFNISKYNKERALKEKKREKQSKKKNKKEEEKEENEEIPENSLIIEKTKKRINKDDFINKYKSLENFKVTLNTTPEIIYQSRYQISTSSSSNEIIENLTNDEIGFSKFIQLIIDKKIPIIGHNIYFDMMFIYDKLIGDLPEDFYSFKTKIHNYFPKIYDTKAIAMTLGKYESTKLDDLYKTLCKRNYNNYISFYSDVNHGFAIYNDLENNKLHDAGYDSIITGRCFVLMCKALENNYETVYKKAIVHSAGNQVLKEEKAIEIKYGFVNLNVFNNYLNCSIMSIVNSNYAKINWDIEKEDKNQFLENENKLIEETFVSVFHVNFNKDKFNYIINIYEISRIFANDVFDIIIVKSGYYSAFIEFSTEDYEKDKEESLKIIENIKNNNDGKIKEIIYIKDFYKNQEKKSI